jgi:hypothetical protein
MHSALPVRLYSRIHVRQNKVSKRDGETMPSEKGKEDRPKDRHLSLQGAINKNREIADRVQNAGKAGASDRSIYQSQAVRCGVKRRANAGYRAKSRKGWKYGFRMNCVGRWLRRDLYHASAHRIEHVRIDADGCGAGRHRNVVPTRMLGHVSIESHCIQYVAR